MTKEIMNTIQDIASSVEFLKKQLVLPNCTEISPKKSYMESLIGKKVIIRTYSAGVHYGTLVEKSKNAVILKDARRLWYWETVNEGISLSEVAMGGIKDASKVCQAVDLIWLEAIEIIPCTPVAILSIENKNVHRA